VSTHRCRIFRGDVEAALSSWRLGSTLALSDVIRPPRGRAGPRLPLLLHRVRVRVLLPPSSWPPPSMPAFGRSRAPLAPTRAANRHAVASYRIKVRSSHRRYSSSSPPPPRLRHHLLDSPPRGRPGPALPAEGRGPRPRYRPSRRGADLGSIADRVVTRRPWGSRATPRPGHRHLDSPAEA
jgi:hypothetical protein